ncbi:ATP-binding protein [Mucilaginibacter sp. P25]|uniref:histidine kinase n=1 Tax=Mucilaginibacter gossypii TaxID=551996 RepID=A0A1G8MJF5_9SPHI|nr:ATP-binding protein [Mucilaginibacter gossypii]SDI67450.1 HAMP domain-containing protein [Mucilaginibacter gossypii]
MTTSGKIRLLLALLGLSLLLTAVIVQKTYTPVNSLVQSARILEDNLHNKEAFINKQLNGTERFKKMMNLRNNEQDAINAIENFTTQNSIWFITLTNNKLSFWSGIKVLPDSTNTIKDGYSFIKQPNGYYETFRKTEGNFSVIFFIPVKINYAFQNKYLQNKFARDLLDDDNIDIADFTDVNVYEVHSSDNDYLFSVKLKNNDANNDFVYYELSFWILTAITLCVLMHNICNYVASKGYVVLSIIFLALYIVLFRFVNLHYNLPDFTYKLSIFNPAFYGSSLVYPSLGDFCINILVIFWFVAFVYRQRRRFLTNVQSKTAGYVIVVIAILTLVGVSTSLLRLFHGLVINSKINFDVNNVLSLTGFSILGVLMLCFSFLIFYLLNEIILTICLKLNVPRTHQLFLFLTGIIIATAVFTYYNEFTLFYILWALLVLIRAYNFIYYKEQLFATSFLGIVFVCALIAAIKLNHFEDQKEHETRRALVQKLEIPDDATADYIFKRIENQIITDTAIVRYFTNGLHNGDYLKTRFQKLYFDGYLSKYEFKVHEFDANEEPTSADKNYSLSVFKDLVLYSSFKVSDYFYRENESFGYQNYFAILPVNTSNKQLGTIVIELKSKPLQLSGAFPELLIDGNISPENDFKDYSYAFYSDNKLLSQRGTYVYSLDNREFKGDLKKYTEKTTKNRSTAWYESFTTYNHLIYRPSERNLIVVSREENSLYYAVTSLTFFLVVILIFSAVIITLKWSWARIKIFNIAEDGLKINFRINFDKVLYKTRIQISMILAVVVTLVLVGFITFLSISNQYYTQQEKMIRDKITRIASAFENGLFTQYVEHLNEESQVHFNELANTYATDLTLFDTNGVPLLTTQPKIYENGLVAKRMNARAFIFLSKLQKTEFVNDEKIGELSYKAAYAPVTLTASNKTVAYIQLPYFSNEADYRERISSLLNVMINVYAIVFIAIGLFAIIIARQITAPLNFIQQSLSKTIYGKKNEHIKWSRDDEIGALVKEYNKMISALENSAQRLAQSERESAWREMAKQVAHEIKNPLTPLKLGLQLLDKSWKDKDPRFDQKFERFSKSFVEQIESLSSIASEFSAFAKMPDTRIEQINIFDMLNQAVTIFKQMDNVQITYLQPESAFIINADRDQLLRCFNNLLKNAIEATPQDRKCIIDINYLVTSKNILLTIKDNGNGIPEEMREKIFEPNFTTKSSGTGLGLAFIKNSIENANGKIWFETTMGTGTTFYLSLPAA